MDCSAIFLSGGCDDDDHDDGGCPVLVWAVIRGEWEEETRDCVHLNNCDANASCQIFVLNSSHAKAGTWGGGWNPISHFAHRPLCMPVSRMHRPQSTSFGGEEEGREGPPHTGDDCRLRNCSQLSKSTLLAGALRVVQQPLISLTTVLNLRVSDKEMNRLIL